MKIEEEDSVLQLAATKDGSGDFLVAIEAQSEGFSGHAEVTLEVQRGRRLLQLTTLEVERKGAAHLVSAMPGEFDLEVKSIDRKGHMGVSACFHTAALVSSSGLCSSFASRSSLIHQAFSVVVAAGTCWSRQASYK